MSTVPSTSTSHSDFVTIFNAALETYKRKTKKDLASHPLLPRLQSCHSSEAILTVLREQIPVFRRSQNDDDGLTKWVTPTVNVLYSFSATIGGGVGLVNIRDLFVKAFCSNAFQAFSPANIIFAGIGVLLLVGVFDGSLLQFIDTHGSQAAKDASASHDKLIDLFNRIEHFFHRLEIYTGIAPTIAMTNMVVEIMVEVLTILSIATKDVRRGRLSELTSRSMILG
jgi:hypothetical protein